MPRNRFQILRRRLVALIGVVLVLLVFQFFLWRAVSNAAGRYQDQRTQEIQLENLQKRLDEIAAAEALQETELGKAARAFPEANNTATVIEKLEGLAAAGGLTLNITSLKEQTTRDLTFLRPYLVTFEVTGSPRSLLEFIDRFEHDEIVIEITTWSLEGVAPSPLPTPQVTPTPSAKLLLSAQIYLQSRFHESR